MSVTSGKIYVESENPKKKVTVIHMNATEVWFEPDDDPLPLCYPRDVFDNTYTLPEESAFVQQQWYMKGNNQNGNNQNGNNYLWVHARVDFPDECTVLCLKFEGDDGQYTMGFLNIDVFRTLIDSYTMCTQVTQVPYPNRVAKDKFEPREPRKSVDPEEKTPGLRF